MGSEMCIRDSLLYMGDIIDDEFEVSNKTIGTIEMPNRSGFLLPDPRPDVVGQSGIACMTDCDSDINVIGKARDLDVTPEDES